MARAVSAAGVGDCDWNKDTKDAGIFTSEAPVPEGLPAPSRWGLPEECPLWLRLCPPKMATCCSGVRNRLGPTPVGDLGCMCEDKLTNWREREKRRIVSNRILTSCQLHRVPSWQLNCHKQMNIFKTLQVNPQNQSLQKHITEHET